MDELREALLSRNIFIWIILIVFLVLFLKFLKNAGKIFMILVALIIVGLVLNHYAPGVMAPISDFVRGGWMGDTRPQ